MLYPSKVKHKLAVQILPSFIRTPLFGYRGTDSVSFSPMDSDWISWQSAYLNFYSETQTKGIGGFITRLGYKNLSRIQLDDKIVLEIGPGSLPHRNLWNGTPQLFISVDVDQQFHHTAKEKSKTNFRAITPDRNDFKIPEPSDSVDIIISFYSLEHLNNLESHVNEFYRILKPGGLIVGAVPNEGGLAWGLGRYFGTRRWIKKRYNIDYDKIIAWEHPNYVDQVQKILDSKFYRKEWTQYPFNLLRSMNLNLISSFTYLKLK